MRMACVLNRDEDFFLVSFTKSVVSYPHQFGNFDPLYIITQSLLSSA